MTIATKIKGVSFGFSNFKSFGKQPSHIEELKPINIVIGRNNTGKSALIDVLEIFATKGQFFDAAKHARLIEKPNFSIIEEPEEKVLKNIFSPGSSGGLIGGNHWQFGSQFIGSSIKFDYDQNWNLSVDVNYLPFVEGAKMKQIAAEILAVISPNPLNGAQIIRVNAERDVVPEKSSQEVKLAPNGDGLTNLIRKFITNENLDRLQVEVLLLEDLNHIYLQECSFDSIRCKENDEGLWEIFLEDGYKGDVRLSQSGSSLKSIFIILAFINLVPFVDEDFDWSKLIFAIEEPENNLHPSLLRRLLDYLAKKRDKHGFLLFITTHSPIGIDWSTRRSDSQVIHIKSDGKSAIATTAVGAAMNYDILDDLDIRASDLLQANCVIWVEGPTDRMYLRKWLELISDGELIEGIHYTAMFYGGKLLSHLKMSSEGNDKLISLISINRNSAILIDSDRKSNADSSKKPRMQLNATKTRILKEVKAIGGLSWVTDGREIENYLSPRLLSSLSGKEFSEAIAYDKIIKLPAFKTFNEDKIRLAQQAIEEMIIEDIQGVFDLEKKLTEVAKKIKEWNSIE